MSKSLQGAYASQLGTKSLLLYEGSRLHYNNGSLKAYVNNLKANLTGLNPNNVQPSEIVADLGTFSSIVAAIATIDTVNILTQLLLGTISINSQNITTTDADLNIEVTSPYNINLNGNVLINGKVATVDQFYKLSDLGDVTLTLLTQNDILYWAGTAWQNISTDLHFLHNLNTSTRSATNNVLKYSSGTWISSRLSIVDIQDLQLQLDNIISSASSKKLEEMSNVITTGLKTGDILVFDTISDTWSPIQFEVNVQDLKNIDVSQQSSYNNVLRYIPPASGIGYGTWTAGHLLLEDVDDLPTVISTIYSMIANKKLQELANVSTAGLVTGKSLVYDAQDDLWKPVTFVINLQDVQDTSITTVNKLDKSVLMYNETTNKWVPNILHLYNLQDVSITDPNGLTKNQILNWNENINKWAPIAINLDFIQKLDLTSESTTNNVIKYNTGIWSASQLTIDDIYDLQNQLNSKIYISDPPKLQNLKNVNPTGLLNNYTLIYKSGSDTWIPSKTVINIEDLGHTLINVNNQINSYVLKYSSSQGAWVSSQLQISDIFNLSSTLSLKANVLHTHTLGEISNIQLTGLANGDTIMYNKATDTWIPSPLMGIQTLGDIPDVDATNVLNSTTTPKFLMYDDNIAKWIANQVHIDDIVELNTTLQNKSDITHTHTLEQLSNMNITSSQNNDTIVYYNGKWIPKPLSGITSLNDIPGVNVSSQSLTNNIFKFDGTVWRSLTLNIDDIADLRDTINNLPPKSYMLNDLKDVNTSGVNNGYVLAYNAEIAKWTAQTPTVINSLSQIGDVDITNKHIGTTLVYNGTKWTAYVLEIADIPNLTTQLASKSPLNHTHHLYDLLDVSISSPTSGNVLKYSGLINKWIGTTIEITDINYLEGTLTNKSNINHTHALGNLSNVSTVGANAGQVLGFNGSIWQPQAASGLTFLKDLADIAFTYPLTDKSVLGYNATSGKWTATSPPGISSIGQLPDVNITGVSANQVLGFNGTMWVPYSQQGIQSIGQIPDVNITNKSSSNNVLKYNAGIWYASRLLLDDVDFLRPNILDIVSNKQENIVTSNFLNTNDQYKIDYNENNNLSNSLLYNIYTVAWECNYTIIDDISLLNAIPYDITYNKRILNNNFFPIYINYYLNNATALQIFKLVLLNYDSSPKSIEIWGHNKSYGSSDRYKFNLDGSGTKLAYDTLNISTTDSVFNYTKKVINTTTFTAYSLIITSKMSSITIYTSFCYFTLVPSTYNVKENTDYTIITGTNGYPTIKHLANAKMNYKVDLTKLIIHESFRRVFPVIYSPTEIHVGSIVVDGTVNSITGISSITNALDVVNKNYVDTGLALKASSTHVHSFTELSDVSITSYTGVQYGSTIGYFGTWKIVAPSGLSSIGQIPDVDSTSKSLSNNLLIYNPDTDKWTANHYGIDDIDDLRSILNSKITIGNDSLSTLSDVSLTLPLQNKQLLQFNGSTWTAVNITTSSIYDIDTSTVPLSGHTMLYNSNTGKWQSQALTLTNIQGLVTSLNSKAQLEHTHRLLDLSDIDLSNLSSNQILVYDGSTWILENKTGITSLDDIPHVTTVNKSALNNVLLYNTSTSYWEASNLQVSTINNLQNILDNKSEITHVHTLHDITDVNITNVTVGQVLTYNGSVWIPQTAGVPSSIGQIPDVNTLNAAENQFLRYDGSIWNANYILMQSIYDTDVTNVSNIKNILKYISGIWTASQLGISDIANLQTALDQKRNVTQGITLRDLTDVQVTNVISGQFLKYDGIKWVPYTLSSAITSIGVISDVDISTKSETNKFLKYIPSTDKWTSYNLTLSDIDYLQDSTDIIFDENMNGITSFTPLYIENNTSNIIASRNSKVTPTEYFISGTYSIINDTGLHEECLWYDDPTSTYLQLTTPTRINIKFASITEITKITIQSDVVPNNITAISIYTFAVDPAINSTSNPPSNSTLQLIAVSPTYIFNDQLCEISIEPSILVQYITLIITKAGGSTVFLKKLIIKSKTDNVLLHNSDYTISTNPTNGYPNITASYYVSDTWNVNLTRLAVYEMYRRVYPVIRSSTNVVIGNVNISSTMITGITGTPTNTTDVVTKQYADNLLTTKKIDDLSDVDVQVVSNDQVLTYDDGIWIPTTKIKYISELLDIDTTNQSSTKNVLKYNNITTKWTASQLLMNDIFDLVTTLQSKSDTTHTHMLTDMTDLNVVGIQSGQVLGYNGIEWVPFSIAGITSIGNIPDVDIVNKSAINNVLKYNVTTQKWTASQIQVSDINQIFDILSATTHSHSIDTLTNVSVADVEVGQVLGFNGLQWIPYSITGIQSIGDIPDVDATTKSLTKNVLKYNGTKWIASQLLTSDISTLDTFINTHTHAVEQLSNVDATNKSIINNVLKYNGTKWLTTQLLISDIYNLQTILNSVSLLTHTHTIEQLSNVDATNKSTTNNVLKYNGTNWITSQLLISDIYNLQTILNSVSLLTHTHSLEQLSNIAITNVQNRQIMVYDSNTLKWKNIDFLNTIFVSTTPYYVNTSNNILEVDTTLEVITIVLQTKILHTYMYIKDSGNAHIYNICINGNGSMIDQSYFLNITERYGTVLLYYNGENWTCLSKYCKIYEPTLNVTDTAISITYNEDILPLCHNETSTINMSTFSFQPLSTITSGSIDNIVDGTPSTYIIVSPNSFYRMNYIFEYPIVPIYFTLISSLQDSQIPITFTINIYATNTTIDINESSSNFSMYTLIVTSTRSTTISSSIAYKYWIAECVYDNTTDDKYIYEAYFTTKTGIPGPYKIYKNEITIASNNTNGYPTITKTDISQQDVTFNIQNIAIYELYRRIFPTIRNNGQLCLQSRTISETYNVLTTDSVLIVNTTTYSSTIVLPSTPFIGMCLYICDSGNATNNNIIINGNGFLINNTATYSITHNYDSLSVYYTGSKWITLIAPPTMTLMNLGDVSLHKNIVNHSILQYSSTLHKWVDYYPNRKQIIYSHTQTITIPKNSDAYVDIGYILVYTNYKSYTIIFPEKPVENTRILVKDFDGNASVNNIVIVPTNDTIDNVIGNNTINVNDISIEYTYSNGNWTTNIITNNYILVSNEQYIASYVNKSYTLHLPVLPDEHTSIIIQDCFGSASVHNIYISPYTTINNASSKVINQDYGRIILNYNDISWYAESEDEFINNVIITKNETKIINYGIANSSVLNDTYNPIIYNKNATMAILYTILPYQEDTTLYGRTTTDGMISNILDESVIRNTDVYTVTSMPFRINLNYGESNVCTGFSYRKQIKNNGYNIKKIRIYGSYDAIDMTDLSMDVSYMELLIDMNRSDASKTIKNGLSIGDYNTIQYFSFKNKAAYQYISFIVYENENNGTTTSIGHIGLYSEIESNKVPMSIYNGNAIIKSDTTTGFPSITKGTNDLESWDIDVNKLGIYELYRRIYPVIRDKTEIRIANTTNYSGVFSLFEYNNNLMITYLSQYVFGITSSGTLLVGTIETVSTITYDTTTITDTIIIGQYSFIMTGAECVFLYNTTPLCKINTTTLYVKSLEMIELINITGTNSDSVYIGNYVMVQIDTYLYIKYSSSPVFILDPTGNVQVLTYKITQSIASDISSYVTSFDVGVFSFISFSDYLLVLNKTTILCQISTTGTIYLRSNIATVSNINMVSNVKNTIGNYTFFSAPSLVIQYGGINIVAFNTDGSISTIGNVNTVSNITMTGVINEYYIINNTFIIENIGTNLIIIINNTPLVKIYSNGNMDILQQSVNRTLIDTTQTKYDLISSTTSTNNDNNFVIKQINGNLLFSYNNSYIMKLYSNGNLAVKGTVTSNQDIFP